MPARTSPADDRPRRGTGGGRGNGGSSGGGGSSGASGGGGGHARQARARAASRGAMRRFALAFATSAVALFFLYQWTEATSRFRPVNVANAVASAAVLRTIGIPAARDGTRVQVGVAGMDIISECSAIYVIILFTAAVLAFPAAWRARVRGLALGIPVLLAVNVLRLVTLGIVLRHRPGLLPFFHEYLWQVLFVLVVAALYLVWIERMVPGARARPAA